MRPVNPPEMLRTPKALSKDIESLNFFDQNKRILFQLWDKLGGPSDQMPGLFGVKSRLETSVLVIATGNIVVTHTNQRVDTEGDIASDDVDTITGGQDGDILCLSANNTARTVVIKHDTSGDVNTIQCGADISLDHSADRITLERSGGVWFMTSFANNG